MNERRIHIPMTPDGYQLFLKCKRLPHYEVQGSEVVTDDRSWSLVFGDGDGFNDGALDDYPHLFDYQRHVTARALKMRRFAAFMECGLGKSHLELAYAHSVAKEYGRVLFLCPLAVVEDIQRVAEKHFGGRLSNLRNEPWQTDVAILNWESRREISEKYAGIVLDESSILKHSDSKTRKWLNGLASGCEFRLACSATPSPNEQAEYGSHAVWLGYSRTLNEFFSRFFVKDEATRSWRLKGHAVEPFYRHLSAWACYIQSPSLLGFKDTDAELPSEPDYRIIDTEAPDHRTRDALFTVSVSLGKLQQIAGKLRTDTTQPRFRDACDAVSGSDRAIIWCIRNAEERSFHRELGGHLITGTTPVEQRVEMIDDFRDGRVKFLTSKPKIMGFGVNLPEAKDMLYSGYDFSFEAFYQAVRRAHRYGRDGRLAVHIPVTDQERPVWDSLRQKMATFDEDARNLQAMMRIE